VAQDAFSVRWSSFSVPLIHPPIPLIPRVLQRLQQERMRAVLLIVPLWKAQAWSQLLTEMTVSAIDLGPTEQVLVRGQGMRRRRERLPPGNMLIAIVDTRTTAAATSLSSSSIFIVFTFLSLLLTKNT
jgi:hypothetical protein